MGRPRIFGARHEIKERIRQISFLKIVRVNGHPIFSVLKVMRAPRRDASGS